MLSDEERKAIDYLQLCYDLSTITNESLSKLGIVLNLIEKQQKEIERLNLENIELKQSKIVDKNSIPNQDNFYDCYNFIHKDKIKAKIEEIDMTGEIGYLVKGILQSLLEKE